MSKNNVTILVNSCDKYEDAWIPFFKLLKIQWPDCPYDIVLSTETKTFNCDCFDVRTVNSSPELSWSSRLKNVLNQIETEYVLFFLEDFFLLEKVQTDCFYAALKLMEENTNLSLVQFPSIEPNYVPCENADNSDFFQNVSFFKPYRAKVMVSLWRRADFECLIFENENPWICERETSIRSMACNKKIVKQNYELSVPAFYYHINPENGYGITGGKWLKNNKPFFESKGIVDVNYDNLGIDYCAATYKQLEHKRTLAKKANFKSIIKNRRSFDVIKELLYLAKRDVLKKTKLELLLKIRNYRRIYKKQKF